MTQTSAHTVYSPDSPLANPAGLISDIISEVWKYRELTWILFIRDLKAQYRQSYLGYLWIFAPIIATTITWMYLSESKIINVNTGDVPYSLFVLTGSLIWNAFTGSVNQPLNSFNAGKEVFMKLNVPVESFLLSGLGQVVFNLTLQTIFLVPIFLFLQISPASTLWLFPLGIVCTMLIGLSLGMAIIPLGSLYTDVPRVLAMGLSFAMLLTPVVYPPPKTGIASVVMEWNPLTPVVMATRNWLVNGNSTHVAGLMLVTACSLFLLVTSLVTLRIAMPRLVERMGM